MISVKKYRGEFIFYPTVPSGTETIEYQVKLNDNVVYVGKTRWFGGEYSVDLEDWIDSYVADEEASGRQVYNMTATVTFIYTDGGGSTSRQVMLYYWVPSPLGVDLPRPVQSQSCPFMYIELSNCGFVHYDSPESKVRIPLLCRSGKLICGSSNRLIKTTYIDKFGDVHNGSIHNKYELDCYVDAEWLGMSSGNSFRYECVMAALQSALSASMKCEYPMYVPGFYGESATDLPGRVKDVEKVDVRTYYDADHKVPTLKITFEIYK